LTDDLSTPTTRQKSRIPALSFLGAFTNAYQEFRADNNLAAGADHVNFKLSGSGEQIGISYANGALIDGVTFGSQQLGVSEGRLPDGTIQQQQANPTLFPRDAQYFNSLDYSICFRKEIGFCTQTYNVNATFTPLEISTNSPTSHSSSSFQQA